MATTRTARLDSMKSTATNQPLTSHTFKGAATRALKAYRRAGGDLMEEAAGLNKHFREAEDSLMQGDLDASERQFLAAFQLLEDLEARAEGFRADVGKLLAQRLAERGDF